jgi:hypothetical protein
MLSLFCGDQGIIRDIRPPFVSIVRHAFLQVVRLFSCCPNSVDLH